jgi:hypothetical protein
LDFSLRSLQLPISLALGHLRDYYAPGKRVVCIYSAEVRCKP